MSLPPGSPARTPPRFVPTLTERVESPTAPVLAEESRELAQFPADALVRTIPLPSLTPTEPPASPAAPAARKEPATQQQADRNFAARMAALRERNSIALDTPPWLAPVVPPRTSVNPVPEQSPPAAPLGDERVARAAPTFSAIHARVNDAAASHSAQRMSAQQASEFEEMLVHRVLQRVDVALDQQLHKAIAAVVQAHSASLLPKLHEEVEGVVRRAVNEAVGTELAAQSKSR